jgi:hypothetical protein
MMIKYAIALAVVLVLAAFATWAGVPIPAGPRRPGPWAGHDRRHAPPGPGVRYLRLAGPKDII